MGSLMQDLRYGFRLLSKAPLFTVTAVLSLAIGIGVNSTVFSIVDAAYLRPWPVKNPSQLAVIHTTGGKGGFTFSSYPDYLDIRNQVSAFSGVLAYGERGAIVSGNGQGQDVVVDVVSEDYFAVLGVKAAPGRTFSTDHNAAEAEGQAVVVSYGLWQRRFGADPALVGGRIQVDGKSLTVLGVTPKEFHGLEGGTDIWVTPRGWNTMVPGAESEFEGRDNRWFQLVARLQPHAKLVQANTQLQTVASRLAQSFPSTNKEERFVAITAAKEKRQGLSDGLYLMGMVGLVLLISCANVANMLLAQTERRNREIAMRLALGADWRRVVVQLLTESLLLAVIGGVSGLLLASWLINLLPSISALSDFLSGTDIQLDFRVMLFTLFLSLITLFVFGLAPGLRSRTLNLVPILKGNAPGLAHRSGRVRFPLRGTFATSEIAFSVVLLVVSGLLFRSLLFSEHINPGFDTHKNVLMVTMAPPAMYGYTEKTAVAMYESVVARLESVPGVVRASYARRLPLTEGEEGETQDVTVPGMESLSGENRISIRFNIVSTSFFRTMGTRILRGRDFTQTDSPSTAKVVIINDAMAQQIWPGQDPVGRLVHIDREAYQIVGVVESGRHIQLHETPQPYMYFPFSQMFSFEGMLFVETARDPRAVAGTIMREAQAVHRNVPVTSATTMEEYVQNILVDERTRTLLLSSLSVVGMFLAAVGLYGVVVYLVSRRTQEFGVRIALGARKADVLKLVLGQGIRLGAVGAGFGLIAAVVIGHVMAGWFYGVKPTDPLTYAVSIAVVLSVTLLASYIPARRALKVDPMTALRYE